MKSKQRYYVIELPPVAGRVSAIDAYRGLALAMMIALGAAKMFAALPVFEQFCTHEVERAFLLMAGYGIYDVIAPVFVFVSGLSFCHSYRSAARRVGEKGAHRVLTLRSFKTMGVGAMLTFAPVDAVGIILLVLLVVAVILYIVKQVSRHKTGKCVALITRRFDYALPILGVAILVVGILDNILRAASVSVSGTHWSALVSIGLSMLVSVPFVRLSLPRKVVGALLLTVFYWMLNELVPQSFFALWTHGGLLGSFGYALLFYYAHTVVELARAHRFFPHIFALFVTLAAYYAVLYMTPAKATVNLPYALVSFVFAYTIFIYVQVVDGLMVGTNGVLAVMGRNSLLVYLLHSFFTFPVGICLNALIDYIPIEGVLPVVIGVLSMLGYVLGMSALVRDLNRRGYAIRL
jgi:hypothetical protein